MDRVTIKKQCPVDLYRSMGHLLYVMGISNRASFGMLDVVLFRNEGDIILTEQGVCYEVEIVDVGSVNCL